MNYQLRAEHIMERIHTLAAISETPHGITRTFGTPAFHEACKLVQLWMQEAGLETRIDTLKNVRGKWDCGHKDAPTMVLASHIDTVINAGAFDGPLGVLAAINIVAHLPKDHLNFHIEVIAFSDEEGVRFHTTYLGSKAVTGIFDPALFNKKDVDGIALKELINGDLSNDVICNWKGYFEIHIEQGPVLYECNQPVAVVTAIAGQQRSIITITGMAGHAGTVPMLQRKDALCAAAEFILAAEQWAIANHVVATVGKLDIHHAASNVIPGSVTLSLDIRSADEKLLDRAMQEIQIHRPVHLSWQVVQQTAPVTCDPYLTSLLSNALNTTGYENIRLVSGAGHDAVPVSLVAPVCMLFVKCTEGISHHPQENVLTTDIAAALHVADQFMLQLIKS